MTVATRVLSRLLGVPPRRTRRVRVERDLRVPMRDGAVLLADRLDPGLPGAPVILIRTPYGRGGLQGWINHLVAERGYQVVVQSCRGTHGSEGKFEPFRNEEQDGIDTLDWLEKQPWFPGIGGTMGPSYLGITQWALSGSPREWLKAQSIAVSAADVGGSVVYPNGIFALETAVSWAAGQDAQVEGFFALLRELRKITKVLPAAARTLPLSDADAAILGDGRHVDFYQDWLTHPERDPWWEAADHRAKRGVSSAAVHMTGGWYDLFLPWQLEDFAVLQAAGRQVSMTIGPWAHGGGLEGAAQQLNGALAWFDAHLRAVEAPPAPAVRACLMGSRRWVDVECWPPPGEDVEWFLQPGFGLAPERPGESAPDTYVYDPADPTPAAGGAALNGGSAGPHNQAAREARPDVLTFTSEPLTSTLTVLGPVAAEIHIGTDAESADVVVTLCDVDPKGKSINLSTGAARLAGPCTPVAMWPTGHEFRPGHRLRVQVASAAHPLYARNLGTGEPLATATAMRKSTQTVFHDPERPSLLRLRRFKG